uniref:Clc-like protein 2 n=1 Tax=Panagrellus redivivus TaxID=6233 RepID=A0A7E4W105_PANRE
MHAISVGRQFLVVSSGTLLLAAIVFCVAALVTPAWQTVDLPEFSSFHQHGLWMDCTTSTRPNQGGRATPHCTYKFEPAYVVDSSKVHPEEEQHKFHEWHKAVLLLFGISIFAAVTALCFTFCAVCVRIPAIVANVSALIAALASSFAIAVFFISSHRNDIRFVPGITNTYEQSKGYSFYLGIISMLLYITAFVVGLIATVFVFLDDRKSSSVQNKTFPKNRDALEIDRNIRPGPTSISV